MQLRTSPTMARRGNLAIKKFADAWRQKLKLERPKSKKRMLEGQKLVWKLIF
jgi:hypothetical protein